MDAPEERHYLCVYGADDQGDDLSDDPCLREQTASWGICRPQIRARWLRKGSEVVFVAVDRTAQQYTLGGRIKVGEIIGYEEALSRFPDRNNVIIRSAEDIAEVLIQEVKWADARVRRAVEKRYSAEVVPRFLTSIRGRDGTLYVQRKGDEHEVDNWKCRRIMLCTSKQQMSCVAANHCQKEQLFSDMRGYVVAAESEYWAPYRITWASVCPRGLPSILSTPKKQHNARKLSMEQVAKIRKRVSDLINTSKA